MKLAMCLYLALTLAGSTVLYAQSGDDDAPFPNLSNFLVATPKILWPVDNVYGHQVFSLGLNVGYGQVLDDHHWDYEVTAFAYPLNSEFDFAANKDLVTADVFTGLALSPGYCINPQSNVLQVSVALSLEFGYNLDYSTVYLIGADGTEGKQLENKNAGGGFTAAFSPAVRFAFNRNWFVAGMEFGYDTSSSGAGLSQLKSVYYHPAGYNSGFLFFAFFFRI